MIAQQQRPGWRPTALREMEEIDSKEETAPRSDTQLRLVEMAHATAWLNFTTAQANHDLQRYGEWRCDYAGQANVLQSEYEKAMGQIERARRLDETE